MEEADREATAALRPCLATKAQLKSRAVLRLGATALTLSKTRCCEGENWSSQEETGKNLRHTQGTASFLKVTRQVLGRAGK